MKASRVLAAIGLVAGAMLTGVALATGPSGDVSDAQQRLLDVSNISLGLRCASPGGAKISDGATYPDACQPAFLCSLSSLIYGPFGLYDPASGDTVANSSGPIDPGSLNLDPGETLQNRFVFVTARDLQDESEADRLLEV